MPPIPHRQRPQQQLALKIPLPHRQPPRCQQLRQKCHLLKIKSVDGGLGNALHRPHRRLRLSSQDTQSTVFSTVDFSYGEFILTFLISHGVTSNVLAAFVFAVNCPEYMAGLSSRKLNTTKKALTHLLGKRHVITMSMRVLSLGRFQVVLDGTLLDQKNSLKTL